MGSNFQVTNPFPQKTNSWTSQIQLTVLAIQKIGQVGSVPEPDLSAAEDVVKDFEDRKSKENMPGDSISDPFWDGEIP